MRPALAILALALTPGQPGVQTPAWVDQLDYRAEDVVEVRVSPARLPLVQVEVSGVSRWLLFDTGNMVGLSLTTSELDRQALPVESTWRRRDSSGKGLGVFRRLRAPDVRAFGRLLGERTIFEIAVPDVQGLIGPDLVPGNRFTLDYRAGLLATTAATLDVPPAGFAVLPMVRSSVHPRLVLAYCTVAGRRVLTEFDTGKTRTVIEPALARELGLALNAHGVRIESLAIAGDSFVVPSAKLMALADIDRSLPDPIRLSVGSDVLLQLLVTVDYSSGRLILRRQSGR